MKLPGEDKTSTVEFRFTYIGDVQVLGSGAITSKGMQTAKFKARGRGSEGEAIVQANGEVAKVQRVGVNKVSILSQLGLGKL